MKVEQELKEKPKMDKEMIQSSDNSPVGDEQPIANLQKEIESFRSNIELRKQLFTEASERLTARLRRYHLAGKATP